MQLIVNGDDLGYSPGVNETIMALYHQGRLSSTSLVASLAFSQEAFHLISCVPDLAVGVHLNLTKGRPLLPPKSIPSLVNDQGNFHATPIFFARVMAGLVDRQEVIAECQAQIECVEGYRRSITHLDSHSHWHVLPDLNSIVVELAREHRIHRIRLSNPARTATPYLPLPSITQRKTDSMNVPASTDYMLSLHQWLKKGESVLRIPSGKLHRLFSQPNISVEMVVHPGREKDPDFPLDTLPAGRRQREFEFLQSPIFTQWLDELHVTMV